MIDYLRHLGRLRFVDESLQTVGPVVEHGERPTAQRAPVVVEVLVHVETGEDHGCYGDDAVINAARQPSRPASLRLAGDHELNDVVVRLALDKLLHCVQRPH